MGWGSLSAGIVGGKYHGGVVQAQASAGYSFRLELRDHVLARHSRSGVCSAPDDFDCQHNDLLYIYSAGNGKAFEAIYFDNEGHVIHYDVSTSKAGTVVFLSDATQPGPQYRLSYELAEGVLSGKFEMKCRARRISRATWNGAESGGRDSPSRHTALARQVVHTFPPD